MAEDTVTAAAIAVRLGQLEEQHRLMLALLRQLVELVTRIARPPLRE